MMGFLTRFWGYFLAAGALVATVWGYGRAKKTEGREQTYIEVQKDKHDREEKGREAATDLRGADRDELVDRLRENDGQW